MGVAVILTILLPTILAEHQEMQLISQLTKYFHFDHHLFLLDTNSSDSYRFISTDGLTPQTVYVWKGVDDLVPLDIKSKNCFLIVATNTTEFEHIINLMRVVRTLQIRQRQMKVGIFFTRNASAAHLKTVFKLCIANHIADTFATAYLTSDFKPCPSHECLLNMFTFHPFRSVSELVNVTGSDRFDDYFQRADANFYQKELRYEGLVKDNLDGSVWSTVFKLMNATVTEIKRKNENTGNIWEKVDVPNSLYDVKGLEALGVYPVQIKDYVVLVPAALPYSELSAYLKNALFGIVFIYSIISTVALIAVLIFIRCVKRKRLLILQSSADVFNLLLNDNGNINYRQISRAEVFVIVPLTFVGFIIVNGFLSNLQSHLTHPVVQPQINTADDIYRSKYHILTTNDQSKDNIV